MTARLDAENRLPEPLYPLKPFTRDEAVKVVAFDMYRSRRIFNDVEGMRFGFVILGVMVLALAVIALVIFALAGVWTKP